MNSHSTHTLPSSARRPSPDAYEAAPLFVPVMAQLGHDGAMPAAVTDGRSVITIEIAGVVVRAGRGVDPVWLRDVLRAVKAAT